LSAKNCFALAALLLNVLVISLPTVEFQYGLQCRPSKKFAARRLSDFRAAESAREKDDKANQQNQAKAAAADDGTAKIKPAAAEQEKQNNHE
jgi:hypothetical protein